EYELLASAIDHINDNLYHTYKPLKIEVKPDYFTEGVKFLAGFDEFGDDEGEVEVNVTAPQLNVQNLIPKEEPKIEEEGETYILEFKVGEKSQVVELKFNENKKRMAVGRTKANDLVIEDQSISKVHAALVLNPEKLILVADTGSTNGTFINGQRIAYGRAFPIGENDKLKFGTVEVFLRRVPKQTDFAPTDNYDIEPTPTEAYQLPAQPTQAAIQPTEAFQLPPQQSETIASQYVAPPTVAPSEVAPLASKVVEYNFDEVKKETIIAETPAKDDEANPTQQHRVKLNFDE
ncbi:MAG: FHA domain-containing protein, partial [Acidobacteriota bacterium]